MAPPKPARDQDELEDYVPLVFVDEDGDQDIDDGAVG